MTIEEMQAQRGRVQDQLNLATQEFHRRCNKYGASPSDATRSALREATEEITLCRARLQDLDTKLVIERSAMQRMMLTAR